VAEASAQQEASSPPGGPRRIIAVAVAKSQGRPLAVFGGDDSALGVWDLDTEQLLDRIPVPDGRTAHALALADLHGRLVAVSGWGDWMVRVHDVVSRTPLGAPLHGHTPGSFVTTVTVADVDGRPVIVSADTVGEIRIWDLESLKPLGEPLIGHTPGLPVFDLASASVEGRPVLASGSRDGSIVMWDIHKRHPIWTMGKGEWGTPGIAAITSVALWEVAGAPVVACGSSAGTLEVRDLMTGALVDPGMDLDTELPGFTALASADAGGGGAVLASGHDDGTLRYWEEGGGVPRVLTSGQERVDAIALMPTEAGRIPVVVVGGENGRIWRWEPLSDPGSSDAGAAPDKVDWLADAPADDDLLQRDPLAQALGRRLKRIREQDPGNAFLVHLDGAWGTGKSTILRFLRRSLEPEWLVVDFDAWRQSRVGPPWWALLVALRERLASELTWFARMRLRAAEGLTRVRRTGAPYLFAVALLLVAVAGMLVLFSPPSLTLKSAGDIAKSLSAAVVALGTLWAGGLLASRFLLWDSAKGAVVYEQTKPNPMEALADHFAWLIARAGKPVAFFVDDLDRCSSEYVVELLEALQTLIRDTPGRLAGRTPQAALGVGPYFVVAADGSWLRTSYEARYEQFRATVAEPGRPLGYLFLDKLFQLTVTVPTVTTQEKGLYLAGLLRVRDGAGAAAADVTSVREQLRRSTTDEQVIGALQSASPATRRALAPEAVDRLSDPSVERATEHALQAFAQLLDPNPRAMKRFVNAYGIARVVLTLENALVPSDSLALWTILRSRWPILAEYLANDPELVGSIGNGDSAPAELPEETRRLFNAAGVREVVSFARGGPMTPQMIRACAGGSPSTSEP
jgi:hypothetical protein